MEWGVGTDEVEESTRRQVIQAGNCVSGLWDTIANYRRL